jgi:hypothetical protein
MRYFLSLLGMILSVEVANAGEPAAIVEEAPQRTGLQIMDYLETGRTITLLEDDTLVIGYLESCIREVIVGGTVTIGFEQSALDGSKVNRRKVNCSGKGMILSPKQMQEGGVLIFRNIRENRIPVSYGVQPVISLPEVGLLTIRRVDRDEPLLRVEKRTGTVDFFGTDTKFTAGGIYRADISDKVFIFAIASEATLADSSLISRLILLR